MHVSVLCNKNSNDKNTVLINSKVIFIAAKLNSCKEEIVNVIGDTIPEHIVSQAVVKHQYNIQAALNELLSQSGILSILQLDY